MFLKSLTLHGFKSFADKTEMTFEPGVTVIVGPNGSGKSNVVDALSWVLGTASPKSLRGASMADVIFAGAPGRSGLGRASVQLSLDNTSGSLPIEFSEVTVSRSMFASGENSYAINGESCRALDVQELLSDTGLGRENHGVVGQGRLEAILNARPEERRTFIDEAAGILKHRRRKERALRKLDTLDGHLERLNDVLSEVTRNLGPLARQAEAAKQHAELTAELTDVRRTRALRELAEATRRWDADASARQDADERLQAAEASAADVRREEAELDAAVNELAPAARAATETHFRLSALVERYRGLTEVIAERRRGLAGAVDEPVAGRDPDELRGRIAEERTALEAVEAERHEADEALAGATAERERAEHARRAYEQAAAAEARRLAEARERRLRWEGEVSALRSGLAQAASEEGRLASQASGLAARREQLNADIAATQDEIQRLDAEGTRLAEQLSLAESTLKRRQQQASEAAHRERDLERTRASLEARADALRAASQETGEGAAALRQAAEDGQVAGVEGPLADRVTVDDGMAQAVAAGLGALGDALVVSSRAVAADAVELVRARELGRVMLLAEEDGADDEEEEAADVVPLDPLGLADELVDARPLAASLHGAGGVTAALRRVLAGVYVVDLPDGDEREASAFDEACRFAEAHPHAVFVTPGGEMAGARGYAGGSAAPSSAVASRAAAERAEAELERVNDELRMAHRQVADADREVTTARQELDAASAAMHESDALITQAADKLQRLRNELETCEQEEAALAERKSDLSAEIADQRDRLAALEQRGPDAADGEGDTGDTVDAATPDSTPHDGAPDGAAAAAEAQNTDAGGGDVEAERLDDELSRAREREVEARLAASAAAQRADEAKRRIQALEDELERVEAELEERERRREARLAAITRCDELSRAAAVALQRAEASLAAAEAERDDLEARRAQRQSDLGAVRARLREVDDHLAALRKEQHNEELRRAELRHAVDAARERLVEEFDTDPDEALAEARDAGDDVLGGGEDRDKELAEQEQALSVKIDALGTVNPLARQEYDELQERHEFLNSQIEDVQTSKRDLLEVVEAVDTRIREVFSSAFADVAEAFADLFPRLFPGGQGRLVLTDPDNLLETGVDVEARPAGKRVSRLSLLSGGERSLTAISVLLAIFRARPSPFYVLDEVEAALDDVNLQRFLEVLADFRATSQLIIVTHQKRTMEAADALYGVSMQADGLSTVVSQRLTDEPAPAS